MENRTYLAIGDVVMVDTELAILSHPDMKKPQRAVVAGFYPNFFDVEYPEGFRQSILYRDKGKVHLIKKVEDIAV